MQDWTGNSKTGIATVGGNTGKRVLGDFYATEPKAVDLLCEVEGFTPQVWECACGNGIMSEALKDNGYSVYSSDLVDRGYSDSEIVDFLEYKGHWNGDIVTNPPYRYALEFIQKALDVIDDGRKAAFFLRLQFLESKRRKSFFLANPPCRIYVASTRLHCWRNGKPDSTHGNAIAFAWFIWEKGFKGDSVVKWIN